MKKPEFVIEIFLQPGEYYWGDKDTRIKTLLGSCVAICVWHPKLMIGGMTHSLLPSRNQKKSGEVSGRYIDEAIDLILMDVYKAKTKPQDYVVKVFGGSEMFEENSSNMQIGNKNIQMAKDMLQQNGFTIAKEHVGGSAHRNIILDLWSGDVWLKSMTGK